MSWKIAWDCWSGGIEAKVRGGVIEVWEYSFGICWIKDNPENRRALELAATKSLGRNGMTWGSKINGIYETVRA